MSIAKTVFLAAVLVLGSVANTTAQNIPTPLDNYKELADNPQFIQFLRSLTESCSKGPTAAILVDNRPFACMSLEQYQLLLSKKQRTWGA